MVWKSFASKSRTATENEINAIRDSATVKCIFDSQYPASNCNPSVTKQPCLFNVVSHPCETHNLVTTEETMMRMLYNKLTTQKQSLHPEIIKQMDYNGANPAKFNQTWSPWQDWQCNQDICFALMYTLNSSLMMKCVMVVPQTNISDLLCIHQQGWFHQLKHNGAENKKKNIIACIRHEILNSYFTG